MNLLISLSADPSVEITVMVVFTSYAETKTGKKEGGNQEVGLTIFVQFNEELLPCRKCIHPSRNCSSYSPGMIRCTCF